MSTERNKFSAETMKFRALNRDEKFQSLLELCNQLGHIPRTYSSKKYQPDDYARVRAQFYINMISAKNRGELSEHDLVNLDKIDHFRTPKLSSEEKIDLVYRFIIDTGHIPTNEDPEEITEAWRSIRTGIPTEITPEHQKKYERIINLSVSRKKTLIDRLSYILVFCRERNRTPKQHSLDRSEKHLADSLSSIKQRTTKQKMSDDERKIFNKILKYATRVRTVQK